MPQAEAAGSSSEHAKPKTSRLHLASWARASSRKVLSNITSLGKAPETASFNIMDPAQLLEHLRSRPVGDDGAELAPVALLRGSWLRDWLSRRADGELLPHRQELKPEALLSYDEVMTLPRGPNGELPIIAVSHCWLTERNPDPQCDQVRDIVAFLDAMRVRFPLFPAEVGVLYDWVSLFQKPRSAAEDAAFRMALEIFSFFYAHQLSTTVVLKDLPPAFADSCLPIEQRSWPTLERAVSGLVRRTDATESWPGLIEVAYDAVVSEQARPPLTTEFHAMASGWVDVIDGAAPNTAPPAAVRRLMFEPAHLPVLSSRAFVARVATTYVRSGKTARPLIISHYRRTLKAAFASIDALSYARLQWSPRQFAALLPHLRRASRLERLDVSANPDIDLDETTCCALAAELRRGAMPKLELLVVGERWGSAAGATASAAASARIRRQTGPEKLAHVCRERRIELRSISSVEKDKAVAVTAAAELPTTS